ncbi:polysaccharide biosynthesis/export family protein [Rhodovulum sp. YNF3179]|uniref:polysaccharide biosynthesis/export family protein n=1 Tax=Rhodovulum sp. YNF3179 TaxID=3425127 RepID=UPI003D3572D3
MRIFVVLSVSGVLMAGCSDLVLRQPSFKGPSPTGETVQADYAVTALAITPEVLRRANATPFENRVVLAGPNGGAARIVNEDDAIRPAPPPANRRFDYVLGIGDVLRLDRLTFEIDADGIEREQVISRSLTVAEGGYVELAEGQQVTVAGRTVLAARNAIEAALVSTSDRLASEVMERPFPRIASPDYRIGAGDVLAISRMVPVSEDGMTTERLVTRQAEVKTDGTVTLLNIGAVEVAGLAVTDLQPRIAQEALRAGLTTEILVDVTGFKARSALVTGDLGSRLVPITTDPLTMDRLLAQLNPGLSRDRDYLVRLERGAEIYQMRARSVLLDANRDNFPVLDGDRIIVERLSRQPAFQLTVERFDSQFVTFTRVGATGVGEITLTDQGLDLRRLLSQQGLEADRNRDMLVRLHRDGRAYRLSAQDVLLDAPGRQYWLKPGDHVIVDDLVYARNTALVIGTVGRPARVEVQPVQRTTLSEALFDNAARPTNEADFGHIYVLRGAGRVFTAYHLDMRDVLRAALAESFELRPGDIVFIRKRPISQFNEVLRMALGLTTAASGLQTVAEDIGDAGSE